ncbi:MAG: hypothetical protein CMD23_01340 [Flavobacteriales bacterium]|nr:hypothetical protein [Flavobacteriales bacterium]|tara:strand:+ start:208 stop:1014 length:807 start_codon:yes stop_codon:yes gene_type:complete
MQNNDYKQVFLIFSFFLFFFCSFSQSIVNTEKLFNSNESGLVVVSELAGNLISGNNELLKLDYSLNFSYQYEKNMLMLLTSGEHIRKNKDDDVTNEITGQFRYIYSVREKVKFFTFFQAQTAGALLLNERFLIGSGVKFHLLGEETIKSKKNFFKLNFSCGLMQEREVLDNTTLSELEIYKTNYTRSSFSSVSVLDLSDAIRLINTTYFQQYIKDLSDYRIFHEMNLVFSFNDRLSLTLDFEYRFDSDPPSVLENSDYSTTIGFVFEL